jgi:hypothetical protein
MPLWTRLFTRDGFLRACRRAVAQSVEKPGITHCAPEALSSSYRDAEVPGSTKFQFLRRCAVPVPLGLTLEVQREPRSVFVNCLTSQPDSSGSTNPASPQQPERFVDASAVAVHFSVTRRQVLEMTRRGIIPGHPLGVGRSRKVWRYKISEVESAFASGVRKPSCDSNNATLARPSNDVTIRPGSSPSQRRKSNG